MRRLVGVVGSLALIGVGAGCGQGASRCSLADLAVDLQCIQRDRPLTATDVAVGRPVGQTDWFRLTAGRWNAEDSDRSGEPTPTEWRSGRAISGDSRHSGPLPGLWETIKRDVKDMPGDLWSDTKAVYTSQPNLVILGLTYGGALALQEAGPDDTVENSFTRDNHRTFSDDWRDGFGAVGNPGTHFALAGLWYLVGQQRQDEETYRVGKTLFSALIINGLSTLAGQAATWDDAPNGQSGTFPSGHTSSSFTFASVMHQSYGPWVGIPLYALSGLVAYERLESGEHYLSDVVMGGVLGLVVGHTVSGEHQLELFGGEIVPFVDANSGTSGIAWVTHFK